MRKERISTFSVDEIRRRKARGESRSDWKRVDVQSDADVNVAIRSDAEWQEFADVDWSKAQVVLPPDKQAISIRLDRDVIEFFKAQGAGYQTRINAVLRHFMASKQVP
jgi:uncharacterized protein (DUF4415 family)